MVRPFQSHLGLDGLRVIAVVPKGSSTSILASLTPVAFALGAMPWVFLVFFAVLVRVVMVRHRRNDEMDRLGMLVYKASAHQEEVQIQTRRTPNYAASQSHGSQSQT